MNQRLRLVTGCSVLLLAGVTRATDSSVPTMPGCAGDSWSYYEDITVTNQRNNAEVPLTNGVLTRTVLESKAPGRLLVQEISKGFQVPPHVIGPKEYVPITVSYCPDGTVDKIVDGASSAAYRLINLETIKLPSVGLKTDLTWSWNLDADSSKGTPAVTASYNVSEDGAYQGIPAWKISFSSVELGETYPGKVSGIVWLRKADLLLLSVDDVGENLPVSGTDDLVRRKLTTYFIPSLETHTPVVTTPVVQGP